VVTHTIPGGWPRDGIPFTFVNGIERAVAEAKEQAGNKMVVAASPGIAQQCVNAGLLDEISVSLVPVLPGSGIPFFGTLGNPRSGSTARGSSRGPA
jgi:dihydrofolate reductase